MGRMRREIIAAAEQGQIAAQQATAAGQWAEVAAAEVYKLIHELRTEGVQLALQIGDKVLPVKVIIQPKK